MFCQILLRSGTDVSQTLRWREEDSNPWSLYRIGAIPGLSRVTSSLWRLPRPAHARWPLVKVSEAGRPHNESARCSALKRLDPPGATLSMHAAVHNNLSLQLNLDSRSTLRNRL